MYDKLHPGGPPAPAQGEYRGAGRIDLRRGADNGSIHHEMGHAFYDKHIAETGVLEEQGTSEGIAMIVEEALGSEPRNVPSGKTVDGILQNCTTNLGCAYELGMLVVKRFQDLKETKDADYALDVYLEAVRNLEGAVTPDTLDEQVAREIVKKEGITLQPGPSPSDEVPGNEEPVNVGYLFFASVAEALSYYLSFEEGEGTFCITLPNIGSVCLF